MARTKITTQKVHKVLQDGGLVSSMFKPSRKINRKGYDISTYFSGVYVINPGPYSVEQIQDTLNSANIKSFEKKGLVGVEIFQ